MPKVSVVITTFNSEKYVEESVASVVAQTFRDIEIIVVDDGSTDRTVELAQQHANRDARIRICPQVHAGKPSITRNTGLRAARGEYVCFLDGDDHYAPEKVERGVAVLDAHPQLPAVFHDMKFTDEDGTPQTGTYLQNGAFLSRAKAYLRPEGAGLFICNPAFYTFMSLYTAAMHTATVMVRRSITESENILFAEDVRIGEDTEFWWLLAKGREVAYVDEILSYYRVHSASVTRDGERYHADLIIVHARNYERARPLLKPGEMRIYRSRIASHYRSLAHIYFTNRRFPEARRAYADANRWHWSWGSSYGYLKALVPVPIVTFVMRTRKH
jgi:glycosyltransferase involved in cell wall biosynthesis